MKGWDGEEVQKVQSWNDRELRSGLSLGAGLADGSQTCGAQRMRDVHRGEVRN